MAEVREDRTRFKASERLHILDEATRIRRQKKALEALEKDNFQDAPTNANDHRQQLNKKLQQKLSIEVDVNNSLNSSIGGASGNLNSSGSNLNLNENVAKKRKLKSEKIKFRKNFNTLIEEEQALVTEKKVNYFSICVPSSKFPARKFCAVCGFLSSYNCVQCGAQYCGLKCLQTHKDTRCLKWTA